MYEKYLPEELFQEKDDFTVWIGGTLYEVHTGFDPNGKQSVLRQFRDLLILHIGQEDTDNV
ncbi:MAG: hypothetical protein II713_04610 [Clostridia bacterium]|nr:hypothetical protein [Clostridia bacterium]